MKNNYQYPLDFEWNQAEMIKVMTMWEVVEKAYEGDIEAKKVLETYQAFKTVVPSIAEERRLGKEFEQISSYSLYHVVKLAKEVKLGKVKL